MWKMSSVSNTDPRTKIFIVICISFLAVSISAARYLFIVLIGSFLVLLFFRVNIVHFAKKTKILLSMVVFIALMQSIFTSFGEPIIQIYGWILMTTGGVFMAIQFILRMMIIIISSGLLSTCSSREIIQGLVQWKLPYEVAFMASMGISFLPKFSEELRDAMIAVQLRGVDLKELKLKQKIMVYVSLLQQVVAGAVLKSKAISMSIEMRGFHTYQNRTSYLILRLKGKDYGIMLIVGALTVIIMIQYLYSISSFLFF